MPYLNSKSENKTKASSQKKVPLFYKNKLEQPFKKITNPIFIK